MSVMTSLMHVNFDSDDKFHHRLFKIITVHKTQDILCLSKVVTSGSPYWSGDQSEVTFSEISWETDDCHLNTPAVISHISVGVYSHFDCSSIILVNKLHRAATSNWLKINPGHFGNPAENIPSNHRMGSCIRLKDNFVLYINKKYIFVLYINYIHFSCQWSDTVD